MTREYPKNPIFGVGAVIIKDDEVVLIKRGQAPLKGHWSLPGGAQKVGETAKEAVVREILEETGLSDLIGHVTLRELDWTFRVGNAFVHKRCVYFLFESNAGETRPQREEGITQCAWFAYEDAIRKLTFQNTRTLLTEAAAIVNRLSPLSPACDRS